MPDVNPLTQVETAIWTLLETHAEFSKLVPVGNRIKSQGEDQYPGKEEISNADLPEVQVVPVVIHTKMQHTSDSSFVDVTWAIRVSTGDQGTLPLYRLFWEIWRAMHDWKATLEALRWSGKRFVWGCRGLESTPEIDNAEASRGIRGWATAWQGQTNLFFSTSDL